MFDRELNGRVAKAELSVYDGMLAEIMGEKERRLRKYLRTHELRNNGQYVRKDKRKAYEKEKCYQCSPWNGWDIVRNVRIAEKIRTDAEDWKIEQENIIADEEQAAIEAEIREYELRRAVEEANHRWWIMHQNWLEWA